MLALCLAASTAAVTPNLAAAAAGTLEASLTGYEEVPAISTRASGTFTGSLNFDENAIEFTISWNQKLTSTVTQAHLHFAQPGVNGAIVVFLCSNLGNGPVGTPACPTGAGEVSGTIEAADVTAGAAAQGIDATQFNKLLRALKAGAVYANVHTTDFPSGEIRGQVAFTQTPLP